MKIIVNKYCFFCFITIISIIGILLPSINLYGQIDSLMFIAPRPLAGIQGSRNVANKFYSEARIRTDVFNWVEHSREWEGVSEVRQKRVISQKNIKYILKTDPPVIKSNFKYDINFRLFRIDSAGSEVPITWDYSTYVLYLHNNSPRNIPDILDNVVDELTYYFEYRSFRPRIKITEFEKPIEGIDLDEFSDWIEEILHEDDRISTLYIFYYDDYQQYPDSSTYVLTGKFYDDDDGLEKLLKVRLELKHSYKEDTKGAKILIHSTKFDTCRERVIYDLEKNVLKIRD